MGHLQGYHPTRQKSSSTLGPVFFVGINAHFN